MLQGCFKNVLFSASRLARVGKERTHEILDLLKITNSSTKMNYFTMMVDVRYNSMSSDFDDIGC